MWVMWTMNFIFVTEFSMKEIKYKLYINSTARRFNSVTLFSIMLLNFKSGNFRGILFKFVCL